MLAWRLTVKLRGRALAPDWSRGCTLSSRTRGDTTVLHGPLQRLLAAMGRSAEACGQLRRHRRDRNVPSAIGSRVALDRSRVAVQSERHTATDEAVRAVRQTSELCFTE